MLIRARHWFGAIVVLVLTVASVVMAAPQWDWPLDPQRYGRMNPFERAQYDKAAELVKQQNYKAAASEFEKFNVQFGDSKNLSYMLFMRGYCLHLAKDRNAAIKVYHEVLDYFPDQTWDAGSAIYHIGSAHIENGDTLKGLQVLKQMMDDQRFKDHPLAAGALRQIAENNWRNLEFDQAVSAWQRVVREYGKQNEYQARVATESLIQCQVLRGLLPGVEQFLVENLDEKAKQDPQRRKKTAEYIWDRANDSLWNYRNRPEQLPKPFGDKITPAQGKALYEWFVSTRPQWEKADDLWGWYDRALRTLIVYHPDKAERQRLLEQATQYAKAHKDAAEGDARLARLCDICREGWAFDLATYSLTYMKDRLWAKYKQHEVLVGENKNEEAGKVLEEVEAAGNAEWTKRAMRARADLYHHRLNRQEQAIKLYTDLNNPPDNLWNIQDCYMRWGKPEESLRTLSEIQNIFPDQASRALWQKAWNMNQVGDKKRAASYAKALLKLYKDSNESSSAHQLLEQYGIKTGGGVINEE